MIMLNAPLSSLIWLRLTVRFTLKVNSIFILFLACVFFLPLSNFVKSCFHFCVFSFYLSFHSFQWNLYVQCHRYTFHSPCLFCFCLFYRYCRVFSSSFPRLIVSILIPVLVFLRCESNRFKSNWIAKTTRRKQFIKSHKINTNRFQFYLIIFPNWIFPPFNASCH